MRPMYDPLVRWLACQGRIHDHLVSQLADAPVTTVADIGCGSGTLAIRLAGQYSRATVTAVDIDFRMLRQAGKKPGADLVQWQQAEASNLPIDSESADAVTCSLLLHHLTDREKADALAQMYRILNAGGKLLLADYARPASTLASWRFIAVRLLDSWHRTRAHVQGKIPHLIHAAGFRSIVETACLSTPLGTVRCYCAIRG